MKRSLHRRLDRAEAQLEVMPIAPDSLHAAFERFAQAGELPEHARLASAVLTRALQPPKSQDTRYSANEDYFARVQRVIRELEAMNQTGKAPCDVRRMLFDEAVSTFDVVRDAARAVLRMLASVGVNLTEPFPFNDDIDLPEFGSMGLHLLGWPEILIRPPYEAQATRVLQTHKTVRQRIACIDQWHRKAAESMGTFFQSGALPEDTELRDLVLHFAEFLSLHAILGGEQDDIMLIVFDVVGTTKGEVRERAIEQLQAAVGHE